jgi:hypothetical protein
MPAATAVPGVYGQARPDDGDAGAGGLRACRAVGAHSIRRIVDPVCDIFPVTAGGGAHTL